MESNYNIADISPECVERITEYEHDLKDKTQKDIILVAYKNENDES